MFKGFYDFVVHFLSVSYLESALNPYKKGKIIHGKNYHDVGLMQIIPGTWALHISKLKDEHVLGDEVRSFTKREVELINLVEDGLSEDERQEKRALVEAYEKEASDPRVNVIVGFSILADEFINYYKQEMPGYDKQDNDWLKVWAAYNRGVAAFKGGIRQEQAWNYAHLVYELYNKIKAGVEIGNAEKINWEEIKRLREEHLAVEEEKEPVDSPPAEIIEDVVPSMIHPHPEPALKEQPEDPISPEPTPEPKPEPEPEPLEEQQPPNVEFVMVSSPVSPKLAVIRGVSREQLFLKEVVRLDRERLLYVHKVVPQNPLGPQGVEDLCCKSFTHINRHMVDMAHQFNIPVRVLPHQTLRLMPTRQGHGFNVAVFQDSFRSYLVDNTLIQFFQGIYGDSSQQGELKDFLTRAGLVMEAKKILWNGFVPLTEQVVRMYAHIFISLKEQRKHVLLRDFLKAPTALDRLSSEEMERDNRSIELNQQLYPEIKKENIDAYVKLAMASIGLVHTVHQKSKQVSSPVAGQVFLKNLFPHHYNQALTMLGPQAFIPAHWPIIERAVKLGVSIRNLADVLHYNHYERFYFRDLPQEFQDLVLSSNQKSRGITRHQIPVLYSLMAHLKHPIVTVIGSDSHKYILAAFKDTLEDTAQWVLERLQKENKTVSTQRILETLISRRYHGVPNEYHYQNAGIFIYRSVMSQMSSSRVLLAKDTFAITREFFQNHQTEMLNVWIRNVARLPSQIRIESNLIPGYGLLIGSIQASVLSQGKHYKIETLQRWLNPHKDFPDDVNEGLRHIEDFLEEFYRRLILSEGVREITTSAGYVLFNSTVLPMHRNTIERINQVYAKAGYQPVVTTDFGDVIWQMRNHNRGSSGVHAPAIEEVLRFVSGPLNAEILGPRSVSSSPVSQKAEALLSAVRNAEMRRYFLDAAGGIRLKVEESQNIFAKQLMRSWHAKQRQSFDLIARGLAYRLGGLQLRMSRKEVAAVDMSVSVVVEAGRIFLIEIEAISKTYTNLDQLKNILTKFSAAEFMNMREHVQSLGAPLSLLTQAMNHGEVVGVLEQKLAIFLETKKTLEKHLKEIKTIQEIHAAVFAIYRGQRIIRSTEEAVILALAHMDIQDKPKIERNSIKMPNLQKDKFQFSQKEYSRKLAKEIKQMTLSAVSFYRQKENSAFLRMLSEENGLEAYRKSVIKILNRIMASYYDKTREISRNSYEDKIFYLHLEDVAIIIKNVTHVVVFFFVDLKMDMLEVLVKNPAIQRDALTKAIYELRVVWAKLHFGEPIDQLLPEWEDVLRELLGTPEVMAMAREPLMEELRAVKAKKNKFYNIRDMKEFYKQAKLGEKKGHSRPSSSSPIELANGMSRRSLLKLFAASVLAWMMPSDISRAAITIEGRNFNRDEAARFVWAWNLILAHLDKEDQGILLNPQSYAVLLKQDPLEIYKQASQEHAMPSLRNVHSATITATFPDGSVRRWIVIHPEAFNDDAHLLADLNHELQMFFMGMRKIASENNTQNEVEIMGGERALKVLDRIIKDKQTTPASLSKELIKHYKETEQSLSTWRRGPLMEQPKRKQNERKKQGSSPVYFQNPASAHPIISAPILVLSDMWSEINLEDLRNHTLEQGEDLIASSPIHSPKERSLIYQWEALFSKVLERRRINQMANDVAFLLLASVGEFKDKNLAKSFHLKPLSPQQAHILSRRIKAIWDSRKLNHALPYNLYLSLFIGQFIGHVRMFQAYADQLMHMMDVGSKEERLIGLMSLGLKIRSHILSFGMHFEGRIRPLDNEVLVKIVRRVIPMLIAWFHARNKRSYQKASFTDHLMLWALAGLLDVRVHDARDEFLISLDEGAIARQLWRNQLRGPILQYFFDAKHGMLVNLTTPQGRVIHPSEIEALLARVLSYSTRDWEIYRFDMPSRKLQEQNFWEIKGDRTLAMVSSVAKHYVRQKNIQVTTDLQESHRHAYYGNDYQGNYMNMLRGIFTGQKKGFEFFARYLPGLERKIIRNITANKKMKKGALGSISPTASSSPVNDPAPLHNLPTLTWEHIFETLGVVLRKNIKFSIQWHGPPSVYNASALIHMVVLQNTREVIPKDAIQIDIYDGATPKHLLLELLNQPKLPADAHQALQVLFDRYQIPPASQSLNNEHGRIRLGVLVAAVVLVTIFLVLPSDVWRFTILYLGAIGAGRLLYRFGQWASKRLDVQSYKYWIISVLMIGMAGMFITERFVKIYGPWIENLKMQENKNLTERRPYREWLEDALYWDRAGNHIFANRAMLKASILRIVQEKMEGWFNENNNPSHFFNQLTQEMDLLILYYSLEIDDMKTVNNLVTARNDAKRAADKSVNLQGLTAQDIQIWQYSYKTFLVLISDSIEVPPVSWSPEEIIPSSPSEGSTLHVANFNGRKQGVHSHRIYHQSSSPITGDMLPEIFDIVVFISVFSLLRLFSYLKRRLSIKQYEENVHQPIEQDINLNDLEALIERLNALKALILRVNELGNLESQKEDLLDAIEEEISIIPENIAELEHLKVKLEARLLELQIQKEMLRLSTGVGEKHDHGQSSSPIQIKNVRQHAMVFLGKVVAVGLLPFALLVMSGLAILVKFIDHGPMFFRQRRSGYNHRDFDVWKIETMYTEVATGTRKATRLGRFLRGLGLDEIPQIFSIIKGDMRWFGPRPIELNKFNPEIQKVISQYKLNDIKPGIFTRRAIRKKSLDVINEMALLRLPVISGWSQRVYRQHLIKFVDLQRLTPQEVVELYFSVDDVQRKHQFAKRIKKEIEQVIQDRPWEDSVSQKETSSPISPQKPYHPASRLNVADAKSRIIHTLRKWQERQKVFPGLVQQARQDFDARGEEYFLKHWLPRIRKEIRRMERISIDMLLIREIFGFSNKDKRTLLDHSLRTLMTELNVDKLMIDFRGSRTYRQFAYSIGHSEADLRAYIRNGRVIAPYLSQNINVQNPEAVEEAKQALLKSNLGSQRKFFVLYPATFEMFSIAAGIEVVLGRSPELVEQAGYLEDENQEELGRKIKEYVLREQKTLSVIVKYLEKKYKDLNHKISILAHNSHVVKMRPYFIEDLLYASMPPDVQKVLTTIEEISKHLQATVSVDRALIALFKEGTKLAPTQIAPIVEESFKSLQWKAQEKGLEYRLIVDLDLPLAQNINAHLLRLVVENLIDNAISYTDRGFVEVRLSVEDHVSRAGEKVIRLSVIDTGIGIPLEDQKRVFNPGERGSNVGNRIGTGVGLDFSKYALLFMDVQLYFQSEVGKGSVFWAVFKIDVSNPGAAQSSSPMSGQERFDLSVDNPWERPQSSSPAEGVSFQPDKIWKMLSGYYDKRQDILDEIQKGTLEQQSAILRLAADSEDEVLWKNAIATMADVWNETILEILEDIAQDEESLKRQYVAKALGRIPHERSGIILQELSFDDMLMVRYAAWKSLAKLGTAETVKFLLEKVRVGNYPDTQYFRIAIREIKNPAAVDELAKHLDAHSDYVRYYVEALGRTKSSQAIEPLYTFLQRVSHHYPLEKTYDLQVEITKSLAAILGPEIIYGGRELLEEWTLRSQEPFNITIYFPAIEELLKRTYYQEGVNVGNLRDLLIYLESGMRSLHLTERVLAMIYHGELFVFVRDNGASYTITKVDQNVYKPFPQHAIVEFRLNHQNKQSSSPVEPFWPRMLWKHHQWLMHMQNQGKLQEGWFDWIESKHTRRILHVGPGGYGEMIQEAQVSRRDLSDALIVGVDPWVSHASKGNRYGIYDDPDLSRNNFLVRESFLKIPSGLQFDLIRLIYPNPHILLGTEGKAEPAQWARKLGKLLSPQGEIIIFTEHLPEYFQIFKEFASRRLVIGDDIRIPGKDIHGEIEELIKYGGIKYISKQIGLEFIRVVHRQSSSPLAGAFSGGRRKDSTYRAGNILLTSTSGSSPVRSVDQNFIHRVQPLFDWLALRHKLPAKADFLLVLGSYDTRVAVQSARLSQHVKLNFIITSGGFGTRVFQGESLGGDITEAEAFRKILIINNVSMDKSQIWMERRSTNSSENFIYSLRMMKQRGIKPKRVIVSSFPQTQLRVMKTLEKVLQAEEFFDYFKDTKFISYAAYRIHLNNLSEEAFQWHVRLAVEEIDRLKTYGPQGHGYMTDVPIPSWAEAVYEELVNYLGRKPMEYLSPKQATIGREVRLKGVGLDTLALVEMTIKPAAADTGYVFVVNKQRLKADIQKGVERLRMNILKNEDGLEVLTPEHILSALGSVGINNAEIHLTGGNEVPIFDGSVADFRLLREPGMVLALDKPRQIFTIIKPIVFFRPGEGVKAIAIPSAHQELQLSYVIDFFEHSLGAQFYSMVMNQEHYWQYVAPARTFRIEMFEEELREVPRYYGHTEGRVFIPRQGTITGFRAGPNDAARHKILDLFGDLQLAGFSVIGHIIGIEAGHRDHNALIRKIVSTQKTGQYEDYTQEEKIRVLSKLKKLSMQRKIPEELYLEVQRNITSSSPITNNILAISLTSLILGENAMAAQGASPKAVAVEQNTETRQQTDHRKLVLIGVPEDIENNMVRDYLMLAAKEGKIILGSSDWLNDQRIETNTKAMNQEHVFGVEDGLAYRLMEMLVNYGRLENRILPEYLRDIKRITFIQGVHDLPEAYTELIDHISTNVYMRADWDRLSLKPMPKRVNILYRQLDGLVRNQDSKKLDEFLNFYHDFTDVEALISLYRLLIEEISDGLAKTSGLPSGMHAAVKQYLDKSDDQELLKKVIEYVISLRGAYVTRNIDIIIQIAVQRHLPVYFILTPWQAYKAELELTDDHKTDTFQGYRVRAYAQILDLPMKALPDPLGMQMTREEFAKKFNQFIEEMKAKEADHATQEQQKKKHEKSESERDVPSLRNPTGSFLASSSSSPVDLHLEHIALIFERANISRKKRGNAVELKLAIIWDDAKGAPSIVKKDYVNAWNMLMKETVEIYMPYGTSIVQILNLLEHHLKMPEDLKVVIKEFKSEQGASSPLVALQVHKTQRGIRGEGWVPQRKSHAPRNFNAVMAPHLPLLSINWSIVKILEFPLIDIRIPLVQEITAINPQVPPIDRKIEKAGNDWVVTRMSYARTMWDVLLDFLRKMFGGILEMLSQLAELWIRVQSQSTAYSGKHLEDNSDLNANRLTLTASKNGASFYAGSSTKGNPLDQTWRHYYENKLDPQMPFHQKYFNEFVDHFVKAEPGSPWDQFRKVVEDHPKWQPVLKKVREIKAQNTM
jgi:UDP-3-O-acyl-N-acetylglucosamine deacetylase/signal transduction histidine kinase/lipopolysaccharide/colanic/teichoic acid biosynthesis glycosyltransferase/HEAT repeat protein/uncharacterized SAM-binding protein YcdF (DUF218 family)